MAQTISNTHLEQFRTEAQRVMQQNRQQQGATSAATEATNSTGYTDNVTLGKTSASAGLYRADLKTADAAQLNLFRSLVIKIFEEQGLATTLSMGENRVDIESLSVEEAQQLIAADGYFGVEQTSERIFQAAVGIAGGDPARLGAIMQGVMEGFAEAEQAFGGTLPEISYQTRDAVIEKLNDWAEAHNPTP
ncbi:MAG: hypothetical protein RBR02_08095 [Desulfuromonadaceae bacterium]|nr:hypothetical protein [Desulfuromonadaceae bacterium]